MDPSEREREIPSWTWSTACKIVPGTGTKCHCEMEMSSGSRQSKGQEVLLRCKGAFVRFGPAWRACDILSSCKSILINSRQRLYPGIIMNCERGMVRGCRRGYPWVTLGEPRLGWAFLKDLHFISSGWTNLNCPPGRPFQFLVSGSSSVSARLSDAANYNCVRLE